MELEGVIGHESVLPRIIPVVESNGGTFLFHGPPSVGKRTVAFETCRKILCTGGRVPTCTCASCKKFGSGTHPDFMCVGRLGKIKVADVDSVLEFTLTAPFLSGRKVVVLDNAEDITWEAANRLLKVLEEPPGGMFFFLITSNPSMLLPTVFSRCVQIEFGHLSPTDVMNVLFNKMGFDLPQARVLGWLAAGSTIDIFPKASQYLRYRDMAFEIVSQTRSRSLIDCLDYIDKIERDGTGIFADMIIMVLTDIMLVQNQINQMIMNVDLTDQIVKLAGQFNVKAMTAIVSTMSQVKKDSGLNVNLNMALKNALIKSYPYFTA